VDFDLRLCALAVGMSEEGYDGIYIYFIEAPKGYDGPSSSLKISRAHARQQFVYGPVASVAASSPFTQYFIRNVCTSMVKLR
jgi:hypothetical protein